MASRLDQRDELLAVALQPPGKVEFQEDDVDFSNRDARGADQLIDVDTAGPQGFDDAVALALTDIRQGRRCDGFIEGG